jgi:hypothetical protein
MKTLRMKTLRSDPPMRSPSAARPGGPPRSLVHNSLFTRQSTPPAPGTDPRRHPETENPAAAERQSSRCAAGPGAPLWKSALVEVNGIEPMTSCLQSRRSPD